MDTFKILFFFSKAYLRTRYLERNPQTHLLVTNHAGQPEGHGEIYFHDRPLIHHIIPVTSVQTLKPF